MLSGTLPTMANPEHVAILQQGIDAWNAWILSSQRVHPDLSEMDISGMPGDKGTAYLLHQFQGMGMLSPYLPSMHPCG
jgi:hypothetical protein